MMLRRRNNNPEDILQSRIIAMLMACGIEGLIFFAVPNGARTSISEAKRLKATGLVAGVNDVVIVGPGSVAHLLEVKDGKKPLSKDQKEFRDRCLSQGANWAVARSIEDAQSIFTKWKLLQPRYEVRAT